MKIIVLALRLVLVGLFLWFVVRHFHTDTGFTEFLVLSADSHDYETPTLQGIPHYHHPERVAYDGQFYVQFALDPLLRDPLTDRAVDLPAYRARRILFSWTAYVLGLGRPAWIVQAYALQNVFVWLVLAWWLARRFPADDWRGLGIWASVMFTDGLLASVRMSLLDGPSLFVVALATAASAQGRPLVGAMLTGVAGLAREMNLLAVAALGGDLRWRRFPWLRAALGAILVAAPLLLWMDYLRTVYLGHSLGHGGSVTWPFTVYVDQWLALIRGGIAGCLRHVPRTVVLVSLSVQAAYLVAQPRVRDPWWRLGAAAALLLVSVNTDVWEGDPGSVTRVLLPLTLSYNLLLPKTRAFWPLLVAGNLPSLLALSTLR